MYLKIHFYHAQSLKRYLQISPTMYDQQYLMDHRICYRATRLLLNGAVLQKKFQPYESHIPYILQVLFPRGVYFQVLIFFYSVQFFMDYNLQGMNFLNASAWEFRSSAGDVGKWGLSCSIIELSYLWVIPVFLFGSSAIEIEAHAILSKFFPLWRALHSQWCVCVYFPVKVEQ